MEYVRFNRAFLVFVFGGLFLSVFLAFLRFGDADNDLILRHQIEKIDRLVGVGDRLDFAVLGDSSAGNGIAADVLGKLSDQRVENFALTGSFGLVGSFYLLGQLHERLGVNKFVLVHSPDVWSRSLQKEAVYKLLPLGSLTDYAKLVDGNAHWEFFKYLLNPQRLADYSSHVYEMLIQPEKGGRSHSAIQSDFLAQREETFASGKKLLQSSMEWKALSTHKLHELQLIQRYCSENKLKCVLMSGPVHEFAYVDLQEQMKRAFSRLDLTNEYFAIDMTVHAFPEGWMGDTVDHVDVRRRPATTEIYWRSMTRYLEN